MNRILLTDGHAVVADMPADQRGDVAPVVPMRRGMLVTVIGEDGSAVRRAIEADAPGSLLRGVRDVPPTEFPAGISAQVWNATTNTPLSAGAVTLSRGDVTLARTTIDSLGWLAFALTRALPLTPGAYEITIAADGFDAHHMTLDIRGTATSWRLERIELSAVGA